MSFHGGFWLRRGGDIVLAEKTFLSSRSATSPPRRPDRAVFLGAGQFHQQRFWGRPADEAFPGLVFPMAPPAAPSHPSLRAALEEFCCLRSCVMIRLAP